MDLGCLDLGCISVLDKQSTETNLDHHKKECDASENVTSATKTGKSRSPKGTGQSTLNALNKFTSQIKKPPHRKNSPINWFPRKKVDSYLKRKIKMLQEIDGMNLTLDETLGDSNPHYSRVLREKMAAREAAQAAMEARKAALVEASWCKILRAARIQCKEAETILLRAEKTASEAFEAATALGVIMYDTPNCPQKPSKIETLTVDGGRSTTHTVTASFDTAFDVDKEVAAAVKSAFIRLSRCPSFDKDEFKELLCKISQNPDMGDHNNNQEVLEISSEYESESGSEPETMLQNDGFSAKDDNCKLPTMDTRQKKYKRRQPLEKLNMAKLVDMMLDRLRCLKEDELSSLATIVATCGLNAALAEEESSKLHDPGSAADYTSSSNIPRRMSNIPRRMPSAGAGSMRYSNLEQMRRKQVESELPSLDKFLVKHMTKLEREVQEAKNSRRNGSAEGNIENADKIDQGTGNLANNTLHESIPNLGSILVKHSPKLEKELEEAKKNSRKIFEFPCKKAASDLTSSEAIPNLGSILIKHSSKLEKEVLQIRKNSNKELKSDSKELERAPNRAISQRKEDVLEVPSLDKFLVKHVSRLEKEVQEAKDRRKNDLIENKKVNSSTSVSESELEKEVLQIRKNSKEFKSDSKELERAPNRAISQRKEDVLEVPSLDKFLVKHVSRLEKEVQEAKNRRKNDLVENKKVNSSTSVSESEKNTSSCSGEAAAAEKENVDMNKEEDSLDKILVKPLHRLEREKMQASSLRNNHGIRKHQNKLGGDNAAGCEGLDKVLVKHVSRLEKEKMQFILKEEEEEMKVKASSRNVQRQMNEQGSLDQILVKHKSRLEREKKMAASQEPGGGDDIRLSAVSRREARERELQEAWGGLSLGNSIKPHLSKLEKDKASSSLSCFCY
ncbi:conserved hypothetical protein [Ricinus communis]|uniref:Uncharacterized protein n=1 Tax=Ricinus communis TaxID=3988 RepID=B9SNB8_RICCO|nr:conserved hypothetical protein [Ricinus communis]